VPRGSAADRRALLSREVEELVVEAKRLGASRRDVLDAVSARWHELFGDDDRDDNRRRGGA
jgi:hypothetical protein